MIARIALLSLLGLVVAAVCITSARAESIEQQARWLALHGGVTGTCHGCATPRMRQLVRRLVVRRFTRAGRAAVRTALCIVKGESGFNPGAISRTDDWGVFQIHRPTWGRSYDWRRILDPVYGVGVGWAMSSRGRDWTPWTGTYGRGACR